jgi:hypothetical protein
MPARRWLMLDIGDNATVTLTVNPADGTTTATCSARLLPAGNPVSLTAIPSTDRATWTAYLPITALGAWRVTWTVTGTGAGVETDTVYAVGGPDPAAGKSYATLGELADYLGTDPPEGAGRLLIRASRLVDMLLVGAWYPVDDASMPTDLAHIAALRDATCAQVEWFDETGDSSGAATLIQSQTVGNVSFSRGYTGRGSVTGPSQRYAPDALNYLRLAGLLPMWAQVYG